MLSLPLVLPPTAVGIVLLELLARRSSLGSALAALGIEIVFTWKAVLLATMVMAFPLLVRSARTAFEEVDPRLVGIARTLGCGPFRAFFRVILPLAWRGVLAGAVLAFARALGEFGATVMVAGNIPGRTRTLALAIFNDNQIGRDDRALFLAGVTAVLAFAALWIDRVGDAPAHPTDHGMIELAIDLPLAGFTLRAAAQLDGAHHRDHGAVRLREDLAARGGRGPAPARARAGRGRTAPCSSTAPPACGARPSFAASATSRRTRASSRT